MAVIPYTTEQEEYLISKINEAKSLGLDLGPIYQDIAEEFNRSPAAIQQKYLVLIGKKKPYQGKKKERQRRERKPEQIELSLDSEFSILDNMKRIIEERNFYKSRYEAIMKELNEIKKLM